MRSKHTKLLAYGGIIALLTSMILGIVAYSNSTSDIEAIKNRLLNRFIENNIRLSMKYLESAYGTLTAGDGTLLDRNGNSIEGQYTVVDSVMEDLGNESTIFVRVNDDFKRISTNVMTGEDRAVGTFLGKDHVAYPTLSQGKIYVGEANVLGRNYYTAYDPIKDQNGNVIGLLFVGIPTKTLDDLINIHDARMSATNLWIIIFRALSLGSLIALAALSVLERRPSRPDPRRGDLTHEARSADPN